MLATWLRVRTCNPGRTAARCSFTGAPSRRQDSTIERIATTFEPALTLPMCSARSAEGKRLVWLAVFRNEFRFPRAFILLPAGIVLAFLANAVRIAALVLVGDAGAEAIAVHGFHSAAGWIGFNLIALGLCVITNRVSWLRVAKPEDLVTVQPVHNPTSRWLLPFLAILAAGMISEALTGDFEWFYPLRFFAGALALVFLRRRYTDLVWRVGWLAPAVGVIVFLISVGLDRFISPTPQAMPTPLAATAPLARNLWLMFRVLGATVTVPVAQELAFRGFLYRRLISPDFDSVSFRRCSWTALLTSSMIFGLLYGHEWLTGALAGALYCWVLIRRGSMGDAVAAHATTNLLVTIQVIGFHRWHWWIK
jgi:exosortase E/protease (VPEID-CTERM system)